MKYPYSVLLSVYHKEYPNYLRESLDSVLCQTLPPDEVVIVKDGPLTDELEAVLADFTARYPIIKIVPLEKNVGLGSALNEGLRHCSHDLVARMDTDDISKPERFEKQIRFMAEHPEVDVCSAWIEEFETDTAHVHSIKKVPETHEEIMRYAKYRSPINHAVAVYRKEAVLKAGGYSGFPEDYYLWVKMLLAGAKCYNLQESLYYCRFSQELIQRRGGWWYAKADVRSELDFYKMGFISLPLLVYNVIIRVTVRLTPPSVRTFIYKRLLRK
ncbi:MAG: glycosyltransferase [Bacteroidales bacterium]|nr:glycosyltransferase [Bacteroidales bacterium]